MKLKLKTCLDCKYAKGRWCTNPKSWRYKFPHFGKEGFCLEWRGKTEKTLLEVAPKNA